jgi:hypothetical protein
VACPTVKTHFYPETLCLSDELIQQFTVQGYAVSFADADIQDSIDGARHTGLKH